MSLKSVTHIDNVRLSESCDSVIIIDQTKLPNKTEYLDLKTPEEIYDAIFHLKVRGAPAIGIFAGYGIYVLAKQIKETEFEAFYKEFSRLKGYVNSSRPTAVNLSHALERMDKLVNENKNLPINEILDLMLAESKKIHEEDIAMCMAISEYGLTLIKDGFGVLTHCNAGPLATSRYGTGLGTLFLGKERGMELKAFCDETRPLLQGQDLQHTSFKKLV